MSLRDAELSAWRQVEGPKLYITFILVYVVVLVTVKTSVCITIRRIAVRRSHRAAVWTLLGLNWLSFLVLMLGTSLYCRPLAAMWDTALITTGRGSCAPVSVLVAIGEVATAVTIASDFALAVLPALVLRETTMRGRAKLEVFGLLSFASLWVTLPMCVCVEGFDN